MDCGTGEIYAVDADTESERQRKMAELEAAFKSDNGKRMLKLSEPQVTELMPLTKKIRKNHMRNKPCVCGSGIKFKRCCWGDYA